MDHDVVGASALGVLSGGRRSVRTSRSAGRESRFRIASLTKPFTAVAAVRAATLARVPLDTPVVEVLPQLARDWSADPEISIHHLLSQTSGLAPTVTGPDVAALGSGEQTLLEAARLTVRHGSRRRPGERWEYYNGNYFLAGAVTAALTGRSYEQALHHLVLDQAGLERTGFGADPGLVPGTLEGRPVAEAGYPRGRRPSGGLISTVDDILTFVEGMLSDPPLLERVAASRTAPDDPMAYGLGWAIGPSGQLYLNGRLPGYRAVLLALPSERMAVVALAARDGALPVLARWVSEVQRPVTGDDLALAIDAFAA